MIIDLEEKTERGSFDLPGGGKVHLRLLTATDLKEMRKACLTTGNDYPLLPKDPADPSKGMEYRQFESRKFDGDLWDEMKWDRIITGYDDLFDKNGKPIPVTKEMKSLLMTPGLAPEFAKAVEDGLKVLKEADAAKTENESKNSLIG